MNTQVSFTPGPWRSVEWGDGSGFHVLHEPARDFDEITVVDGPNAQADAALIAAAPDLLEALEGIIGRMDRGEPYPVSRNNASAARAAIAKARGNAE